MNKIDVILMASGNAKRFGENKLLYLLDGMPLIEHTLKYISKAENASPEDLIVFREALEESLI